MTSHVILKVVLLLLFVAFSTAPAAASIVAEWNEAALEEVRNGKMGPPVVARALAVAHTCMYDAWAMYDKRAIGTVLGDDLRRPKAQRTDANKAQAISFAAYRCLMNLFADPAQFPATAAAADARLTAFMISLGYNPADTSTDVTTPVGLGNGAAAAVIEDRRHDGSNQYGDLHPGAYSDYTGYAPVNLPLDFCLPTMAICPPFQVMDPLHWQPLIGPPELGSVTQVYIGPHWGLVRPFALRSADQFDHQIPDPQVFRNAKQYKKYADEVLKHSRELDATKKLIVEYWADGPASEFPPGHWGLFAQFVSARDSHTIDEDAKLFFAVHSASMDAGIVAWHVKRQFDSVRPITAIRYLYQGTMIMAFGGPGRPIELIPGEKWMPYNPGSNLSPAFASYISGHSTFSPASAVVLEKFTGSDYFGFSTVIPANFGRVEPGVPAVPTVVSYDTFSEAAEEAAVSRIYGGIHFSDDNDVGLKIGKKVGKVAWRKAQALFRGERHHHGHDDDD